jgi:hypothetical protein
MPTRPDQPPPREPGLIPLTVAEIKRLFNLFTRRHLPEHHWSAPKIPDICYGS